MTLVVEGKMPPKDEPQLTAAEVSALDLRGVDLAVLSAGQKAQGDHSREGLLGLQRAFQMAGARSVIASQSRRS